MIDFYRNHIESYGYCDFLLIDVVKNLYTDGVCQLY